MIKTLIFALISVSFSGWLTGDSPQTVEGGVVRQLSAHMSIRKIQHKRVLKYEVDLLYKSNGSMISYFLPPNNRYILSDSKGDLRIYNPDSNRVKISRNEYVSTDGAFLGYFLRNETETIGLGDLGFELKEVRTEDSLRIANWELPIEKITKMSISKVEMVHKNGDLVFLGYFKPDGSAFKKNFFTGFQQVGDYRLPTRTTEIFWISPKDSIVEDVRYSNYRLNEAADSSLTQFRIPDDAEID